MPAWLCASGRMFSQPASYIVDKMRLSCKIHHEIETRITFEEGCLREIFEKELQLQKQFIGSNLADLCICPTSR